MQESCSRRYSSPMLFADLDHYTYMYTRHQRCRSDVDSVGIMLLVTLMLSWACRNQRFSYLRFNALPRLPIKPPSPGRFAASNPLERYSPYLGPFAGKLLLSPPLLPTDTPKSSCGPAQTPSHLWPLTI